MVAACEELKIRVIDLRKVPTFVLVRHLKKTFAAGWCVKDIVGALERNPEGEMYLTRGAGGISYEKIAVFIVVRTLICIGV